MPSDSTYEAIFDVIATTHARSVVDRILDGHRAEIERTSDGLAETLADWTMADASFSTVWDISFGRAGLAMKTERTLDLGEVAARVALRIAEAGHAGAWTAEVKPTPMMFANTLVDDVTTLEVDVGVERLDIVKLGRGDGASFVFRRNGTVGQWAPDGVATLPSFGVDAAIALLPATAVPRDVGSRDIFAECSPVESVDAQAQPAFQAGIDVLQNVAPRYVPWVERVLHGVVVCAMDAPFRLVSGSWEDIPAFIHLSCPHAPIDIADILVHESAHQYFYMLQRVGPLEDGSDTTLYWSPPTRKNRPLTRILMAFHALMNVLQVYESVREHDTADAAYVMANEPALRDDICALDEPLRRSDALTDLGRGLYEPLAERLETLGI